MKMLPRLQAEERLGAIDVALLAAGGFEAADARQMLDELRRKATGAAPPQAVKAAPQDLAAMGIAVIEVPVSKAEQDG